MNSDSLNTEKVDALFEEHAVLRMTGDWTRYDASITEYLNQYDRVGGAALRCASSESRTDRIV
jgi:hypothetical protein